MACRAMHGGLTLNVWKCYPCVRCLWAPPRQEQGSAKQAARGGAVACGAYYRSTRDPASSDPAAFLSFVVNDFPDCIGIRLAAGRLCAQGQAASGFADRAIVRADLYARLVSGRGG